MSQDPCSTERLTWFLQRLQLDATMYTASFDYKWVWGEGVDDTFRWLLNYREDGVLLIAVRRGFNKWWDSTEWKVSLVPDTEEGYLALRAALMVEYKAKGGQGGSREAAPELVWTVPGQGKPNRRAEKRAMKAGTP